MDDKGHLWSSERIPASFNMTVGRSHFASANCVDVTLRKDSGARAGARVQIGVFKVEPLSDAVNK
jgi:hypothetical protein